MSNKKVKIGMILLIVLLAVIVVTRMYKVDSMDKEAFVNYIESVELTPISVDKSDTTLIYNVNLYNWNNIDIKDCTVKIKIKKGEDNNSSQYTEWIQSIPTSSDIHEDDYVLFSVEVDRAHYGLDKEDYDHIEYEISGFFGTVKKDNEFFKNGFLEF